MINVEKKKAREKKYRESHKEQLKEKHKLWEQSDAEHAKQIYKKAHEKFVEKNNWSEYCNQAKKRQAKRLREQGVLNPWSVLSSKKYEKKYKVIDKD